MAESSGTTFRPMHEPPHPGLSIKLDCLEPADLIVTEGAKAFGVSRRPESKLINGSAGISPRIALRLAKAFGGTLDMWFRLQMACDLAQAIKREADITRDVRPVSVKAWR